MDEGPSKSAMRVVLWAVALTVGGMAACMPDVPQDAPPADETSRVQPVLDSEAETVPLPNSAALDEQGTVPELEGHDEESARGVFLTWLGQLHGWLTSTPIEIPFNGRLDEESLTTEAIKMYELSEEGGDRELAIEQIGYREAKVKVADESGDIREVDGSIVTVQPEESLENRTDYAVVVSKQVEGANGEPVLEPQPIFFAASRSALADENGEKLVESLPDDATAQQLEALRQSLQPVFARAASDGIDRTDVAMAFRWSTVQDPLTILDPASETIPLPNTAALDTGPGHPPEQQGTFPVSGVDGVEVKKNVQVCETDTSKECSNDDECLGGDCIMRELAHVRTEDTAQAYFNAYLDELHGWPPPPQTPITLPIDGPIDATTVGKESVQVWRMPRSEDEEAEQVELENVEYDAENGRIVATPAEPLVKRHRFVAFATQDVKRDVSGTDERYSLKLPVGLQMAIQPHPVLEDGKSTVGRISDEQAKSIEGLRSFMRPAATFVEEETETSLDNLGAIWTWETWTDTFAVFDPDAGSIPFPNELVRSGPGGTVCLPPYEVVSNEMGDPECRIPEEKDVDLTDVQRAIFGELNARTGFSTSAPSWIPIDGPVDPSTISKDEIQFANSSPQGYSDGVYELDYRSEWGQVVVRTRKPWNSDVALDPTEAGFLNLGIVTKGIEDDQGRPIRASPAFVFQRSPFPLVNDEGESTVDQLDDASANRLESVRSRFREFLQPAAQKLVSNLELESIEDVALVYAFHPQNTSQPLQELRAQALAKLGERGDVSVERACGPNCAGNPNTVQNPGGTYTPQSGTNANHQPNREPPDPDDDGFDLSNVGRIQWAAQFETVEFRDSMGRLTTYQNASAEPVGISVFLPKTGPNCSGPFPVAIAQHGLGGNRVDMGLAVANALGGECVATVTMDFPGHGGRTPVGERETQPMMRSPLHPKESLAASGQNFFSAQLIRTKNNLFQSAVDVAVLAEIVQNGGLEGAIDDNSNTDFFVYDENTNNAAEPVGYVGHSLGGFVGFPVTAVDSNITVAAFNGAGGGYSDVLSEGSLGGDILSALDAEEGTFERFQSLSFVQWVADPIDPVAFARWIDEETLVDLNFSEGSGFAQGAPLPANQVLMQMAENPDAMGDDEVVPNATTERLAEASGLSVSESTYSAAHGFFTDLNSESETFEQTECARQQVAAWIGSGLESGTASYPDSLKASACTGNSSGM